MATMTPSPETGAPVLTTRLGPITLRTPVIAASGTFGYGTEFSSLADLDFFGAITLKSVSLDPRPGNPYPRIAETPSGMLNCIGLENPGIEVFLKEKLPESIGLGVALIASLVGDRVADYVELARRLGNEDSLTALEINASCPNVDHGYEDFSGDPGLIAGLVSAVRTATTKPLIAKLGPNVQDILPIARAAIDSGADIVNLGNTFLGMAIDVETRASRVSRDYAGLSGRAIRPLALRIVHEVASALNAPIIGTGGIYETSDALEFLIAGARAVSVGTVNFMKPEAARAICEGLKKYLSDHATSLEELVGSYKGPACCTD
jgi:dihydroorotate dehydrogenase (NAD+) catalytic subunit